VFGLLLQAGIEGKQIGWHSFRHFACDEFASTRRRYQSSPGIIATGEQRTTLDIYTRAVSQQKRDANKKVVELMLLKGNEEISAPFRTLDGNKLYANIGQMIGIEGVRVVDLIGIEPMTSSMPWKRAPSCATGPQRVGTSFILLEHAKSVKRFACDPCFLYHSPLWEKECPIPPTRLK
jgi:hypothetical protein